MADPASFDPGSTSVASGAGATAGPGGSPATASDSGADDVDLATLIDQLNQDRLWLLRQIDSGRWAEWRLDLAALERELGQLLEQARERGVS
jgi:hypothetical protein